ncbi:transducin/WD40 repeat-like superfamily protein [Carex rostrata]
MPPPKDLPGFYYDAEKNRYFPIKGPIPGSKRTASAALATCSSSSKESKIQLIRKGKRIKISHLLGLREIQGRDILFNSRRYYFHKQYEEIQASQPTVWKFESTKNVHRAIERICIQSDTETGTRNALLLAASRNHGSLSFFQVDNPEGPHLNVESVWSPRHQNEVSNISCLTIPSLSLCRDLRFPSEVSCVKQSGGLSGHVLVTTLGSGESKGSLYSLDANAMSNFLTPGSPAECLFSMDGTVWTADCNSSGTYVALGTSTGPALLDLETRSPVRIIRSKSDVLSQQFLSSGNVVLCGLRNGSILTFDTREKQISGNTEASDWSSATPNPRMTSLHTSRRERRRNFIRTQVDKGVRSGSHVHMTSAVCSIVSLSSDENYFIASSMDGSIKLFDIRLGNGGVQSYRGHVNSHNHLQLAVNPSETLLLSGGEDCKTRIWSIKTGELLFSEMFSESCCTTVLWPGFQGHAGHQLYQSQSSGAWLGSRDGLYYMQVI